MSETNEQQTAAEEQQAAAGDATEQQQSQETEQQQAQQQPEEGKKDPPWFMKRIDAMNRRNADLAREKDRLEAELAVLRAGRTEETDDTKPAPRAPDLTQEAIDAAAERKLQERLAAEARTSLIERGVKELGVAEWQRTTEVLAAMGAQGNAAFMDALYELPEAPKLIAALADEPNKLETLLAKRPAAMATEMARMAVQLTMTKPKQHSSAAAPVEPVGGRGSQAAPDIYDTKTLSAKEWIALRNKQAPRHLGGQRKSA